MTIRDAWYEIFLAYSTPRGERTAEQRRLTQAGVCHAITVLYDNDLISGKQSVPMRVVVGSEIYTMKSLGELIRWSSYFTGHIDPANDELRADWCYLQYLIAGGK